MTDRHSWVVDPSVSNTAGVPGRQLIGTGLTAEVFAWGDGQVLKLFLPWVPENKIVREFSISRAVHAAGLPVPAAREMTQVGGRHGIILERIDGVSLLEQVQVRPWTLFAAARRLAELHCELHSHIAPAELPSQREQIERWVDGAVDFSPLERAAARRQLECLPDADHVCHGDFHPGNILLTTRGPIVIDWASGTRGYALADVARTSVLFEQASLPPDTTALVRLLMRFARRRLHKTYLTSYFRADRGRLDELERWRVPQRMAASTWRAERKSALARLSDRGAADSDVGLHGPLAR